MKSQKPKSKYPLGYNYAQNVDTSDMPDNIHYFLVLPINAAKAKLEQNYKKTIPTILTYEDDSITFLELIKQYKRYVPAYENKDIAFTTQNYQHISLDHTVKLYKTLTSIKNFNGMILCVHLQEQQHLEESKLPFYVNECCVNNYNKKLMKQSQLKSLCCQIPIKEKYILKHKDGKEETKYEQKKVFIFIDIPLVASGLELKNKLINKLNSEYGKALTKQHIQSITIDRKMELEEKANIFQQSITNESHLALFLVDNNIRLSKKKNLNCKRQLLIFKEGDKDQQLFEYEQIWHMTFQQVYQAYLKIQESEQKVEALYCLKIMDFIIKPEESMGKIDHYFQYMQETAPAIFVGRVVNQKMLFYKMMPQISLKRPFSVNQLNIPQYQATKREVFRDIVRQKAKTARHPPLKSQKNLEPIMLYTSDLMYIDQEEDSEKKVYYSLNFCLRNSRVLSLDSKDYESDWRYRYASVLLKQLGHIQRFKGKVYRGIDYDPKVKKDNILTFKQFTSTSQKIEKARFFADQKSRPEGIIYDMEVESGFPIKQYSHFPGEDEVLMQPFTEFTVTKIEYQTVQNKKYKIYFLKQILTPKKLPSVCANFIIWIDNTPTEGKKIFEFLIPEQTTLLIQLKSTNELKDWLSEHIDLISDKTANLVFLTNMTRKQKNGLDQQAGIKAIQQLRRYSQTIPICLYIGDIKRAHQKLLKNKINKTNIAVLNEPNDVAGFLLQKLVGNKK